MKDAEIVADGPPEDTLTQERLAEIYGVRARVEGRTVQIDGAI
jgi:iron complex transport system ATP-binding protein